MATPKNRGNGRFTEAGYFNWIRGQLRRARWHVKYDALQQAKRQLKVKKGNQRFEYQCAFCKDWFKAKEVQVDHIKPTGELNSFEDLPRFVETLFCELDNFQVLCKECHKVKTEYEKKHGRE